MACLVRFSALNEADDLVAAGWTLAAIRERVTKQDLTIEKTSRPSSLRPTERLCRGIAAGPHRRH